MNIADFIYKLNFLGFSIWLDGNDKIQYKQYKKYDDIENIIAAIKENKKDIIQFLVLNNCRDDRLINNQHIYISNNKMEVLSFSQERLWFVEKYENGTNAYNVPMVYKLLKDINLACLEKSLRSCVDRHEIFRTMIREDDEGHVFQWVFDEAQSSLEIPKISVTDLYSLHQALTEEINRIFRLSTHYPIRVCFYELSVNDNLVQHYLSVVVHHIAFDGWSVDLFLKDLNAFYCHYLSENEGISIPTPDPLQLQYKDFALWQRNYLQGEVLAQQVNYWKGKLYNYETLNLLPNKKRPIEFDYKGKNTYFELSEELSIALRDLAKELNISLYCLLLSGFYLMLRIYSNQDDLIVGSPIANRDNRFVENVIGFFINSLALRIVIDSKMQVKDFIKYVASEISDAQLHQDLPFEKLVDELKVEKETSLHPIFQVMFVVQHFGSVLFNEKAQTSSSKLSKLLEPYSTGEGLFNIAKFDLTVYIDDSQTILKGNFNYAFSLYSEETILGFIESYIEILKQMSKIDHPIIRDNLKVSELIYLTEDRFHQIVNVWNKTEKEYSMTETIDNLFETQAKKTPNNIAVVHENIIFTYEELNKKSSQLANYLINTHNVRSGALIVVCLERSIDYLVSILGILKTGAAYVPIDPSYLKERIPFVLEDSRSTLIITHKKYEQALKSISGVFSNVSPITVLSIHDDEIQNRVNKQPVTKPSIKRNQSDLAYIIYTSGTTGKPKGVMIEHKSVVNYIFNLGNHLSITSEDVVDFSTSISFDLTITTTVGSLCLGARIIIYQHSIQELELYQTHLINHNITTIKLVPSFFELLIDFLPNTKIRKIILGGEKLNSDIINRLVKLLHGGFHLEIYDEYGPTEATVGCTISQVYPEGNFTIGKPYFNYKIYVLDSQLKPLPTGAIGELYIGGDGLSRGYLNQPELTAQKFINNPFQTNVDREFGKNAKLYGTGDLVRWLSDGNLEYLGRNDDQVKINGYRIELNEIEISLRKHGDIAHAAVLVKENSLTTKILVAYVVPREFTPTSTELREFLSFCLPEYMIPSVFIFVPELPLTNHGKLDKQGLLKLDLLEKEHYIAPSTEVERQICVVWAEILGLNVEKIGIKDDFFKLGGDSILSIQLVSKLKQRLKLDISVKDIFGCKTIEKIHDAAIKGKSHSCPKNIKNEQDTLSGELSLLPIQEWFFANNFSRSHHYNQSFILKTSSLDMDKLKSSIEKLIEHHDCFRLKYTKDQKLRFSQFYDQDAKPKELLTLDISTFKCNPDMEETLLQEILTKWQSGFTLEMGNLYCIAYIYGYKDNTARLFFALHHLITDTFSWRILIEDLCALYYGKSLGPKGSSYRQWGDAVKAYALIRKKEKTYWMNVLSHYKKNYNSLHSLMPYKTTNSCISFNLDNDETLKLLTKCNQAYNTQINDILLAAFAYALFEITKNKVNYITLESHGREEIDASLDINRTCGWFTTLYPVKLELYENLKKTIQNLKENLRLIPNKGFGFGAFMGYQMNSLPKITFNYLGQLDNKQTVQDSIKTNMELETAENLWDILNVKSGVSVHPQNKSFNIIEANGFIIEGKLKFNIHSKLENELASRLATVFEQQLKGIIEHCTRKTTVDYTISDFSDFEPYVILNDNIEDEENYIFLLPPADGGAESYLHNIASQLKSHKLILFNNYYSYLKNSSLDNIHSITIEKLANDYICYIKSISPNGPYNFLGWSFGGILAYEIARQLLSRGDTVTSLVMIDSFFNYQKALDETNQFEESKPINQYLPIYNSATDTNIILFKASKAEEIKKLRTENLYKIYKYYAERTPDNHLGTILASNCFELITMEHDHSSWKNDVNQLKQICNHFAVKNKKLRTNLNQEEGVMAPVD